MAKKCWKCGNEMTKQYTIGDTVYWHCYQCGRDIQSKKRKSKAQRDRDKTYSSLGSALLMIVELVLDLAVMAIFTLESKFPGAGGIILLIVGFAILFFIIRGIVRFIVPLIRLIPCKRALNFKKYGLHEIMCNNNRPQYNAQNAKNTRDFTY